MVHGLRGGDDARVGWLAILAAVRGVAEHDGVRGSGCGEVFEAIVLLDRYEAQAPLDLLSMAPAGGSSWRADGVLGTAEAFARAGYPYQQARTRVLAAFPPPGPGRSQGKYPGNE